MPSYPPKTFTDIKAEAPDNAQFGAVVLNGCHTTMTHTFVRREGAESENSIFHPASVIPRSQNPTHTRVRLEEADKDNLSGAYASHTQTKTAVRTESGDQDALPYSLRAIPLCY